MTMGLISTSSHLLNGKEKKATRRPNAGSANGQSAFQPLRYRKDLGAELVVGMEVAYMFRASMVPQC